MKPFKYLCCPFRESDHQEPARRTETSRHPSGWEIVRKIDQKDRKYIDKILAPPQGLPPERKVFRAIRDAMEKGGMPPTGPDWVDAEGGPNEDEAEEEVGDEAEAEEENEDEADAEEEAEEEEEADDEVEVEPGPVRKKLKPPAEAEKDNEPPAEAEPSVEAKKGNVPPAEAEKKD